VASRAFDDVVCVGRLAQIVHRAQLDRGDGGRDVAIAGEHDGTRVLTHLVQGIDDIEAVAVLKPQVDHGIGRRGGVDGGHGCGHRVGYPDIEAALLHGPFETGQEGLVIIDKEQGAVRRKKIVNCAHLPHDVGLLRSKVKDPRHLAIRRLSLQVTQTRRKMVHWAAPATSCPNPC